MKTCPFCAQEIQDAAIRCRFCHSWLAQPPQAQYPPDPYPSYPQAYPQAVLPPALARQTSGMAIASLVLGILWIYWLGSILALVFGYLAKGEIRRANGRLEGNGLATAGIVLGWLGAATLILMILLVGLVALFDNEKNKPATNSISQNVIYINPWRELARVPQPVRYFLPQGHLPS